MIRLEISNTMVQVDPHASKDEEHEKPRWPPSHKRKHDEYPPSSDMKRVCQGHNRREPHSGAGADRDGSKQQHLSISHDDGNDGTDASESPPSPTLSSTSTVAYSDEELRLFRKKYPTIKWDASKNCIDDKDVGPDQGFST